MEPFALVFRLVAIAIVLSWVVQIAIAIRKPPEWRPPGAERFPLELTRNRWIVAGVLGIIAGVAVLGWSFVMFPN